MLVPAVAAAVVSPSALLFRLEPTRAKSHGPSRTVAQPEDNDSQGQIDQQRHVSLHLATVPRGRGGK